MPLGDMNMTQEQTNALTAGARGWFAQHPNAGKPISTPTTTANPVTTPTVTQPTTNVAYPTAPTQKMIGPILGPESSRPMVPVNQPPANNTPPSGGIWGAAAKFASPTVGAVTGPFTGIVPGYGPPALTNLSLTTPTGQPVQGQGTDHIIGTDGKPIHDGVIVDGKTSVTLADLQKALGTAIKPDANGGIKIGNQTVGPLYFDKTTGAAMYPLRSSAEGLGMQVKWDDATKTATITNNKSPDIKADVTPPAWTPPDVSGYQKDFMPYGTFNGDMNNYYTQAHSALDAQYNAQKQALIDKQNKDITASDESMNRRGIYSSGVAQSVEDDLRTKTTAAVANVFNAQMANIQKTAEGLYNTAYKQYMDGNAFALKHNEAVVNNMLKAEKQSFDEYIGTQKLTDAETKAANDLWYKQASLIQKDTQSKLKYEYQTVDNAANNATKTEIALLPYQHMTVYQQMTTQEKAAMDGAMIAAKQQGLELDAQKLAESITHNRTTEANTASHNAATEAHATQIATQNDLKAKNANLFNIWKDSGKAPVGIDGVAEGTPFLHASSATKIDSKESFNQSASIKSQLNDKLTNDSKNIDKTKAKAFIDANKDILTDSDYRDLQAWADSTFKK